MSIFNFSFQISSPKIEEYLYSIELLNIWKHGLFGFTVKEMLSHPWPMKAPTEAGENETELLREFNE